jgi:hypothetical protein
MTEENRREYMLPPVRYRTVGPWGIHAYETDTRRLLHKQSCADYGQLLAMFANLHLPPHPNRAVAITDSEMQLVLGYISHNEYEVEWSGTDQCFEDLAAHFPAETVALYEAVARGALPARLISLVEN